MGLNFKTVYRLSNVGGNFLPGWMVAMGVRVVQENNGKPHWQFLVNSEVHGGHSLSGEVLSEIADGTVEILDAEKRGDDGGRVLWRFEPLTLARWEEMANVGQVTGYEELRKYIKDDADVVTFYVEKYMDDWWQEFPE